MKNVLKLNKRDWIGLAVCQYIGRFTCLSYHGGKGILPVQTLSLGKV